VFKIIDFYLDFDLILNFLFIITNFAIFQDFKVFPKYLFKFHKKYFILILFISEFFLEFLANYYFFLYQDFLI
jgi:hypothetical protein